MINENEIEKLSEFKQAVIRFFNHKVIQVFIPLLIIASVIVAGFSIYKDSALLERLNKLFLVIFCIELIFRAIVHDKENLIYTEDYSDETEEISHEKRSFWWEYKFDLLAVVPEAIILIFFHFDISCLNSLRASRLGRFMRMVKILRFFHTKLFEYFKFIVKELLEKSLFFQLSIIAVVSILIAGIFSTIFYFLEFPNNRFLYNAWFSIITFMSDNSLYEVEKYPKEIKSVVFLLTLCGMIIFNGVLIALIVTKLQLLLEEINKGKGKVFQKDHYLILGGNSIVPSIIQGLNTYNQTENKSGFGNKFISTLNLLPWFELNKLKILIVNKNLDIDYLSKLKKKYHNVKLSFRSEDPYKEATLLSMGIKESKAIIIFGNETQYIKNSYENDLLIIKTFALISMIFKNVEKKPFLVLNFKDKKNACYITNNSNIKYYIFSHNFYISNMFINYILNEEESPSKYLDLFTYEESELHLLDLNTQKIDIQNLRFYDLFTLVKNAIPLGIYNNRGEINLLPGPDQIITASDSIILVAETNKNKIAKQKNIIATQNVCMEENIPENSICCAPAKKSVLIIGVNKNLPDLVNGLSEIGYEISLCNKHPFIKFEKYRNRNFSSLDRIKAENYIECDFDIDSEFKKLNNPGNNLKKFDIIIILADYEFNSNIKLGFSASKVDAETYFKVLKLNKHMTEYNFDLICEIFKKPTADLLEDINKSSNLKSVKSIHSTKILETIISMVITAPQLKDAIDDLISRENARIRVEKTLSQIYSEYSLTLPQDYFVEINKFIDVQKDCYEKFGLILIGYLKNTSEKKYCVNPKTTLSNPIYENTKFMYIERTKNRNKP